ncbi:hypothetical protein [Paenarthrobacter sp. YJN-D]|uniref:hypothetical protein n=1 Tax=Paenarthrobacter sp. YJN-D TaxID=2735317 RepID=UPI001878F224|nr:hypothetical protein [Paenarthrobacter sp. YJN-D]QOT23067.1 hypothetical protein HMI60_16860 [Paenarthrobacter sp. YJN-D]
MSPVTETKTQDGRGSAAGVRELPSPGVKGFETLIEQPFKLWSELQEGYFYLGKRHVPVSGQRAMDI